MVNSKKKHSENKFIFIFIVRIFSYVMQNLRIHIFQCTNKSKGCHSCGMDDIKKIIFNKLEVQGYKFLLHSNKAFFEKSEFASGECQNLPEMHDGL